MTNCQSQPDVSEFHPTSLRSRLLLGVALGVGSSVGIATHTVAQEATTPTSTESTDPESGLNLGSSSQVQILAGRPTDFWLEGDGAESITNATFEFTTGAGSAKLVDSPGPGSEADPAATYTFDTTGAAVPVKVTVERDGETTEFETTLEVISLDTINQEVEPPQPGTSGANRQLTEIGGDDDVEGGADGDPISTPGDNDDAATASSPIVDLPPPPNEVDAPQSTEATGSADPSPTSDQSENDSLLTAAPGDVQRDSPQSTSQQAPSDDNSAAPNLALLATPFVPQRRRGLEIVDESGDPIEPFPGDEPGVLVATALNDTKTTLTAASNEQPRVGGNPQPRQPKKPMTPRERKRLDKVRELCAAGFIAACGLLGGELPDGKIDRMTPKERTEIQEKVSKELERRRREEERRKTGQQPDPEPDPEGDDGFNFPNLLAPAAGLLKLLDWFWNGVVPGGLTLNRYLQDGFKIDEPQLVAALDGAGLDGLSLSTLDDYGISFDNVSYDFLRERGLRFDVSFLDAVDGGVGFSSSGFNDIAEDFDLSNVTFENLTQQSVKFAKLEDLDRELDLTGVPALDIANAGVEGGYTLRETANTGIDFEGVTPAQLDEWIRFDGTDLATFEKYKFDLAGTSYQELVDRGADFDGLTFEQITDANRGLTLSGTSFDTLAANNTDFGGTSYTDLTGRGLSFTGKKWADVAGRDDIDLAGVKFSTLAADLDFSFVIPASLTAKGVDISEASFVEFADAGMFVPKPIKPIDNPFRDDPDIMFDESDDPNYDDPLRDDPLIDGDDGEPFDDPASDNSVLNDDRYATSPTDNDPFDNDPLGTERARREKIFPGVYEDLAESDPYYSSDPKPSGLDERRIREDIFPGAAAELERSDPNSLPGSSK
jgi:hypothetical protein